MNDKIVSVIIPIYNQEKNIKKCISSLKKQTVGFDRLEIILINDGSKDETGAVCRKLVKRYPNILYAEQENRGVSAARNRGMEQASGKYIFFLDADDCLEKHTIQNVTSFFESVYDKVDLVTYPIETIYDGKVLKPHFRYLFLRESGIYDLREYAYIGQTTMNIVIKNGQNHRTEFDEGQTFSEDQKFCCDVLKRTLKMGFCKSGRYLYYRDDNSASGRLAGACYIFEQCMGFFEKLFDDYEEVPAAFQGLYVNDIYWKLITNILFPYHYEKEEFDRAVQRIRSLLQRCDNAVILNHPQMDFFEKYYLLRLRGSDALKYDFSEGEFLLKNGDAAVVRQSSMELVVTKMRIESEEIEILGFVKSVFLQFYDKEVVLCAVENGGKLTRKLRLFESAHCYYLSREKTQRFLAFRYRAKISEVFSVRFEVGFGSRWFPAHFYFMPRIPLSHKLKRYQVVYQGCKIRKDEQNVLWFKKDMESGKKRIWLYYDCAGVARDNGYLQFEHDIKKDDGIQRFYIVTDERQKDRRYEKYSVPFGSKKHKWLLENCDKILTAYIEESNIFPYGREIIEEKADKLGFQIIYLQHGVLHIIMPWKFSPEKIMADKIVVSTTEEKKLYMDNGFTQEDLICSGMARFEMLNKTADKKRKILFAPSWRSYLAGNYHNHKWDSMEEKFEQSAYYQGIMKVLESPELSEMLSSCQYQMDVKLHPIFSIYRSFFPQDTQNIKFVDVVKEEEYSLVITDFSSFMYDFFYLGIPVINYIPDIVEFKSGMNGYRDLNYSADFWTNAAFTPEALVNKIKDFLQNGINQEKPCHFFEMDNCRENLYQRISQSV